MGFDRNSADLRGSMKTGDILGDLNGNIMRI